MTLKAPPRGPAHSAGRVFDVGIVVVTLTLFVAGVTTGIFRGSWARPGGGPFAGAATGAVQTTAASIPRDDTLELVQGGDAQPLAPGRAFRLGGNLLGRVSLAHPSGSRYVRNLDLELDGPTGQPRPATDATVVATAHMVGMDMGTIRQVATPASAGHYRLEIPFAMSGEWQVDLQITTPTDRQTATLHLFVWT